MQGDALGDYICSLMHPYCPDRIIGYPKPDHFWSSDLVSKAFNMSLHAEIVHLLEASAD